MFAEACGHHTLDKENITAIDFPQIVSEFWGHGKNKHNFCGFLFFAQLCLNDIPTHFEK